MKRGDVVLLHISYVGATGGKIRPALVVQSDSLNAAIRETIVAEITSNVSRTDKSHHLLIDLSNPEAAGTGLLTNSAVRCERLHTVPQADVRRFRHIPHGTGG